MFIKFIRKLFGVAIILVGLIFGLVSIIQDKTSIVGLVISLILIFIGYKVFKGTVADKEMERVLSNKNKQRFSFNVAGVTNKNDAGLDVQDLLEKYAYEVTKLGDLDKYEGINNKEILEYDAEVYETEVGGFDLINLEFEPTNPYDLNAIKVIHEDIGHIGYVPKDLTEKVKSIILSNPNYEWQITGGKYKYVDENEDKVITENRSYGLLISLIY